MEAAAKRTGMNLSEYVNKTFGANIFGDISVLNKAALAQAEKDKAEGKVAKPKAGGVYQGVAIYSKINKI